MTEQVQEQFRKLGVRVKVSQTHRFPILVNVLRDRHGEYFTVRHRDDVEIAVADVTPWNRHLLLTARSDSSDGRKEQSAFLCGRDECHWFVAAIPETARACSVQDAKDALKPREVWESVAEHNVPLGQYDGRRNAAFVRQGEWFFIPRPQFVAEEEKILHDEPIRRGAGKPHMCQHLYRIGGEKVHVSERYPSGLTKLEFRKLSITERQQNRWSRMVRDARVFVKGFVRHPDHKPIWLSGWHEVVMNTELQSRAMQHVAFLD